VLIILVVNERKVLKSTLTRETLEISSRVIDIIYKRLFSPQLNAETYVRMIELGDVTLHDNYDNHQALRAIWSSYSFQPDIDGIYFLNEKNLFIGFGRHETNRTTGYLLENPGNGSTRMYSDNMNSLLTDSVSC
jgi:hypothetical protein